MPESLSPGRILVVLALAAGFCGTLLAGCSSPQGGAGRATASQSGEPGTIAVRNDSGAPIAWVRLEAATGGNGARRMGEVAPLPTRTQQEVTRGDGAAALPDEWLVTWRDATGRQQTAAISLRAIKAAGPYGRGDVLVVRFGPRGAVDVDVQTAGAPGSRR